MALLPNTVADAIAAAVQNAKPAPGTAITPTELQTLWQNIMGYIFGTGGGVKSGVVSTTVAVASVSGVTTGPGVSGPGAGTGTGSMS